MATVLKIQDWMITMSETIHNAQNIPEGVGPSKPRTTADVRESNEDGAAIEVSFGPTFGFDEFDVNEVNQLDESDDLMMVFEEEEESNGSQHSTSKSKEKKKKKKTVVRR